jgi:hypothetical protein
MNAVQHNVEATKLHAEHCDSLATPASKPAEKKKNAA